VRFYGTRKRVSAPVRLIPSTTNTGQSIRLP
jgi:hypothetical protein